MSPIRLGRWTRSIIAGITFLALLLLSSTQLQAQDARLKRANEAYERMAYPEAIKDYEKVLAKKFDKTAMLRLADSYRLTNNDRKAAEVYSKVVNLNQIDAINYFYFAQALMNMAMYPEALKWFDRYAKAAPADPRGAQFAASCRNIQQYFADSAEVAIRPFPHNTKLDEFGPIWYKGGILFSSSRGEGDLVESKYDWNGQPFLDLYYCKMTGDGDKFSRPTLVKGKLNTRFHEATCAWDSLNNLAYFTRNNYYEGKKTADANGILNLKLFYADVPASGPWLNVRSLPFNSDDYSSGHPAVMAGGTTLLFISDRPGGIGGTDIYRSERLGEGWSEPVNLGPRINTPGNEMFPYISPDGMLYYSSDGMGGLGGLDVFACRLEETMLPPRNLGAPINSASDDFGFLISPNGAWGMLSSNRLGGAGSDDMFVFHYKKPLWNCVVLDAETRKPVAGARVELHLPAQNQHFPGTTNPSGTYNQLLQRNATYQLLIDADQYRSLRSEVSTYGAKSGDVLQDTFLLERPSMLVVTKVLDPATGYPIAGALVRVVGTNLSFKTDSVGTVSFYYDPYPEYEFRTLDCPEMEEPNYCFVFTDEGFAESDTMKLTYEWSFGDGTKASGLEVRHCYRGPGTYHVELNLLDAAGQVFMNQSDYELEVRPPSGMVILGPDTVTVGTKVNYDASNTTLAECLLDSYQWELSDGYAASGTNITHAFAKPGRYTMRLNAGGHGTEAPRACSGCVTRTITVMPVGWDHARTKAEDSLRLAWNSKKLPLPRPDVPCTPQKPVQHCFTFTDDGELPSDTMPFIYRWDMGDGHQLQGLTVHHCYDSPGNYEVQLEVLDPYSKKLVSVRSHYEMVVEDTRQVYIECYDTVGLAEAMHFDGYRSDVGDCKVESVAWNFGDGATATGPEATHAFARKGSYRVEMVMQGIDAGGKPCARCTYKQIQVVPGYRGNQIRDSLRTLAEWPDEALAMPDGTILLDIVKEGYHKHQLSFDPGDKEGTIKDSVYLEPLRNETSLKLRVLDAATGLPMRGLTIVLRDAKTGIDLREFDMQDSTMRVPLDPGKEYLLLARRQGYLTPVESVGPQERGTQSLEITLRMQPAEIGQKWVLHNLYYDFDKSYIRNDAALELAKLVVFLQANPGLQVELGSHTDVRGSDAYNLTLSQARAESAVAFLVAKGIAPSSIVAHGYGEQRLTNGCADGVPCSEEMHQSNRRTEITVLGFKDPIYSIARPVEEIWGTESIMIPSTPATAGPFTILVGTYLQPHGSAFFAPLAGTQYPVTERAIDGFWCYTYGDFPNYDAAAANLQPVISHGYPNASILAVPAFTLPAASRKGTSITDIGTGSIHPTAAKSTGNPDDDGFYAVQVGALGKSVQPSFLASFGEYRPHLFEREIGGRRVFFVGRYPTPQEAMRHLIKIRKTGHADAFLVRFDRGQKVNLNNLGGF